MAKVANQLNSELQGEHYLDLNYLHVGPTKNGGGGRGRNLSIQVHFDVQPKTKIMLYISGLLLLGEAFM